MECIIATALEQKSSPKTFNGTRCYNRAELSNSHKFKDGFVRFDHGKLSVPGLEHIHIKSQYPRLKPKFERGIVDYWDLKALCTKILLWVNDNFNTSGREEYFKQLVYSSVLFVVYTYPQPDLYSDKLDLCIKWSFWLWYDDDVIEDAIKDKIRFADLKRVTDQFQSILLGKYDRCESREQFENLPNYPVFGELFDSLLKLHNTFKNRVPDYVNRVKKNYYADLRRYFGALTWYCVDEVDEHYSEESFKTYRRALAHFDGIADLVALIEEVHLSDDISNSLSMKRLLDVANAFGGFANDLLGMKKEFENGEKDNLVVFMVSEKKIPVDVAVRRVCEFLASELADYNLVKRVILKEFNNDYNLIKYLDILDSLIDGYNVMHSLSSRHLCAGSVKLTR